MLQKNNFYYSSKKYSKNEQILLISLICCILSLEKHSFFSFNKVTYLESKKDKRFDLLLFFSNYFSKQKKLNYILICNNLSKSLTIKNNCSTLKTVKNKIDEKKILQYLRKFKFVYNKYFASHCIKNELFLLPEKMNILALQSLFIMQGI